MATAKERPLVGAHGKNKPTFVYSCNRPVKASLAYFFTGFRKLLTFEISSKKMNQNRDQFSLPRNNIFKIFSFSSKLF